MHIAKWMVNSTTVTNAQLQKKLNLTKTHTLPVFLILRCFPLTKSKSLPYSSLKISSELVSFYPLQLFAYFHSYVLNLLLYFTENIMKRAKLFDFTVANNVHL